MNIIGHLHGRFIHPHRVERLAAQIEPFIPPESTVLDVGCGDGRLAHTLLSQRPDLELRGLDVLPRPATLVPVEMYDGRTIPAEDRSVDVVLFVDVLHHTDEPAALLREAARVARTSVVLKDHLRDSPGADTMLRFMDWVGNAPSGVRLPYNYLDTPQWRRAFVQAGLDLRAWQTKVDLYNWPASLLFNRSLHVIASLAPIDAHG